MSKKAVIVFSGGQDSTTCLIQALPLYDEVHCITFDYGQRHVAEIEVAQKLAKQLGATVHKVMDVSLLNELAISSLTRHSACLEVRAVLSLLRPLGLTLSGHAAAGLGELFAVRCHTT